ncbi:MAG: hypothetical protein CL816_03450 [Coxiellaceae bacterium]|nr:hypothetical protein [Coxiellaceae bacterium]
MKQSDVYRLAESAPIKMHNAKMILMSLCGNSGGGFDWSTWSKRITVSYIYKRFNRYSGADSDEMHDESISMRTITRALKELQSLGVITMSENRSKGDHIITLNIDKLVEMSKPPPMSDCHTPMPDCHTHEEESPMSDCHTPMPDCHTPPDKLTYPPMPDCPPPMSSWPTPSVKLAHNKVSLSLNKVKEEDLKEEGAEDDSHLSDYQKAKLRSQRRHKNSSIHSQINAASSLKARSYS